MTCDCDTTAAQPTETHPIALPKEAGFYEAADFPLKDGYYPVYLTADGRWSEVERDFRPETHDINKEWVPTMDLQDYADHHGPFRKIDPDKELTE